MSHKKRVLGAGLALLVGALSSQAAEMFSDVPRGHWAYDAIQRAVDAGVLEGVDGQFMGKKLITRHQMAVIVAKLLDRIERGGTSTASKLQPQDVSNLEALTIEFADELALMNVKVSTLEDAFVELKNTVEAMKAGHVVEHAPHSPGAQFSGLLSLGVISSDDRIGGSPNTTRYVGTPDQFFFTVPQASLGLDLDLGQGIGVHSQFDYASDGASLAGPPGTAAVQLNEAYMHWDNGPGELGLKGGIMALPFQSWEYDGPQRTLNHSITPSTVNWFWETFRVVGVEAQKAVDASISTLRWRAGLFTGNDNVAVLGGGPAAGRVYGNRLTGSLDSPVSGTGTATFDDTPGFYLDVEGTGSKNFGWRIGYFDVGGDNAAGAPAMASNDLDAIQVGGWAHFGDLHAQAQGVFGSEDYGTGAANTDDFLAWYASLRYDWSPDSNLLFRLSGWEVDNQAAATGPFPGGDREGSAFTFAYNRRMTDNSLFQFEYLAPSEDTAAGSSDINDDLVQARYKVWW